MTAGTDATARESIGKEKEQEETSEDEGKTEEQKSLEELPRKDNLSTKEQERDEETGSKKGTEGETCTLTRDDTT